MTGTESTGRCPDRRRHRRHLHRHRPARRRTVGSSTRKVASTPDDYGAGDRGGLASAARRARPAARRSPRSCTARPSRRTPSWSARGRGPALLTTKGFRDVLEMRRLRMPRALRTVLGEAAGRWWRAAPPGGGRARRRRTAQVVPPARRGRRRARARPARSPRASRRSRSACCTRTPTRPTSSGSATLGPPALRRRSTSRSRATCCRRSASTSAPARRSSTPTWGRSCGATCASLRASLDADRHPRPAADHAVERRRHDRRGGGRQARPTSSSPGRRPA